MSTPSLHHRSTDYRCTPASLERAIVEAAKERAEVAAAILAADQDRHAAILVLGDLVEAHGLDTIQRWLRNLSALHGPIVGPDPRD